MVRRMSNDLAQSVRARRFTLDEDEYLRTARAHMTTREIGLVLGRHEGCIRRRMGVLRERGLLDQPKGHRLDAWREDDDEYLLSCWGAGQERQVARDLGRSVKACEERAEVLGITRSRNWWREEREIA